MDTENFDKNKCISSVKTFLPCRLRDLTSQVVRPLCTMWCVERLAQTDSGLFELEDASQFTSSSVNIRRCVWQWTRSIVKNLAKNSSTNQYQICENASSSEKCQRLVYTTIRGAIFQRDRKHLSLQQWTIVIVTLLCRLFREKLAETVIKSTGDALGAEVLFVLDRAEADSGDSHANDMVSINIVCPEIPVGGRHFFSRMEENHNRSIGVRYNSRGLQTRIPSKAQVSRNKTYKCSTAQIPSMQQEISVLLQKNAIEVVDPSQIQTGFYSTLFLVPKKNGKMRPVINLKPLNIYLKKNHFKMDTISSVLNLVEKGDFSITLDLSDAYFHIQIFKPHRKFLRFAFQGIVYQFRALCFGPTGAPRTFTKVNFSSSSTFTQTKCSVSNVPRRLVCSKPKQTNFSKTASASTKSAWSARFSSKLRKVKFDPKSSTHVHRGSLRAPPRSSTTRRQPGYKIETRQ